MKIVRNIVLGVLLISSQALVAMDQKFATPRNFGWLIDGQLCGLARPVKNADLKFLEQNNVGLVITLTGEGNLHHALFEGTKLERLFLPIKDYGIPTFQQVDQFVDAVDKTISEKKAVAAHCAGGIGRTGTMLACYLVAKENMDAETAIKTVRVKRPHSVETEEQEQFVADYAEYCKTKATQKNPVDITDAQADAIIAIAVKTALIACFMCALTAKLGS